MKINNRQRLVFIFSLVLLLIILFYIGAWAGVYLLRHGHFFNVFIKPDNIVSAMWKWDSNYYVSIAEHGYLWNGNFHQQQNIAFFPLYPIAIRLSHILFGGWSSFVVIIPAAVFGILSIIAFFYLALLQLPEKQARIATTAYTLFPGSMWFFSAYPISLINIFIIISMIGVIKKRGLYPYIVAGIGTSAGPTVVFYSFSLFVFNIFLAVREFFSKKIKLSELLMRFAKTSLNGIISLSGIIIFMIYQEYKFGNPLAFETAQKAFINKSFFETLHGFLNFNIFNQIYYETLLRSILFDKIISTNAVQVQSYFIINILSVFVISFGIYISLKRKEWLYFIYSLITILCYMWFFGATIGPFNGARILYASIPTFIMIGSIYRDNRYAIPIMILAFILCLILQTSLDTAGYTIY